MKILHVLSSMHGGGGPRLVYDALAHWPTHADQVMVAGPPGSYAGRFRAAGVLVRSVQSDRLAVRGFRECATVIREFRPDVLHTHGKGAGLYGRVVAAVRGLPAYHTPHGFHPPGRGHRAYLCLERALARRSTILWVSEGERQSAEAEGFRPHSGRVVLGGVDPDGVRRRVGVPVAFARAGNRVYVGTVGDWRPVKGVRLLHEALVGLPSPRPLLVVINGEGDAVPLIAMLDVYLSGSAREGLPLSILEAMALGKPVVATDVPGNRDCVVHGVTGFLAPRRPDEFARLLRRITLLSIEERAWLGANGLSRVEQSFHVKRTAAGWRGAYEQHQA